ncbi:dTDP-glucose 4,6-dehydratase [Lachnospiraceae bacterium KM106-2]|nr:dTDP-glucose 4,6-dehydratase [Lachnospiraceae bacterium KM106-2]
MRCNMNYKKYLITGGAGFIGFHLSKRLLEEGYTVVGYDNLNDYYDVEIKKNRVKELEQYENYRFYYGDLKDYEPLEEIVKEHNIKFFINLAAQAGVRYSITHPRAYIDSNVIGMFNVLEVCRNCGVEQLLYASSSSVYGNSNEMKFREDQMVDHPVSLYAATKKSNELFAHVYSNNFKFNSVGLRFFTVYGPNGRPDMAYYTFTEKILNEETIEVYNYGKQYRDFTFIDDLITSVMELIKVQGQKEVAGEYKIYNIGNGKPVMLMDFIQALEETIGKKAKLEFTDRVVGDVDKTYADVSELEKIIHTSPKTDIRTGLKAFYSWYEAMKTGSTEHE